MKTMFAILQKVGGNLTYVDRRLLPELASTARWLKRAVTVELDRRSALMGEDENEEDENVVSKRLRRLAGQIEELHDLEGQAHLASEDTLAMLGRAAGSLALAVNQELDRREGKTEELGDPAADYEKGYHDAEQLGDALALVNRLQITNKDGSPIAPWAVFDLASQLSELLEDLGLALPANGN